MFKIVKKLFVFIGVAALLATAQAQPTPPAQNTNGPTIQHGFQELIDAFKDGNTNWYFEVHGLYAPSLAQKYGGGIGAFHPISQYVIYGARLDYVNGGFWMPSGSATFQVPLKLTSWLTVTPLTYAGIGVPVSGATFGNFKVPGKTVDNNGQATAILGYGAAIDIYRNSSTNALKWYQPQKIAIVGDRETWSGFPGFQYRIGMVINKSFK